MFQVQGSEPINVFFGNKEATLIYAASKRGLIVWSYKTADEIAAYNAEKRGPVESDGVSITTEGVSAVAKSKARWIHTDFHRFENNNSVKVKSVMYHMKAQLIVVGSSNGHFTLHQMPEYGELYRLNISSAAITSVAINPTGEWLAFGCKELGQLLVWEWRSETYVLKQQGHAYAMSALAYSPDGQTVATGGDDGKVKIWNAASGFCFVTFHEHEAPITAVKFSPANQAAIYSASMDGSVRAFDLQRYRNFRTFVSPSRTQFSCLAVDASGELVCAGSQDTFEVYVWSVRTGRLTDVLSGHTAPVHSIAFDPSGAARLATGSWDKTVRVWDIYEDAAVKETIQHKSDVLAVAFSPDGKILATSTLDGSISFFETESWTQTGVIDGRNDIAGGRGAGDSRTAMKSAVGKAFTSIAFTPNGAFLLAGGDSKFICIYHVEQQLLLKRYQTSTNLSLDGIMDNHDWRKMSEFGHTDAMERDFADDEDRNKEFLPGAQRGDLSKRSTKKKAKTHGIAVSPTGRAWAATTTDGLMIYSLDETLFFDPTDLSMDISPKSIRQTLADEDYLRALVMSLKLNEKPIIEEVYEAIPSSHVPFVCHEFPLYYLKHFVRFLSYIFDKKPHIELQMKWVLYLFNYHGKYMKSNSLSMIEALRNLQKGAVQHYTDLSKVLKSLGEIKARRKDLDLDNDEACSSAPTTPRGTKLEEKMKRTEEKKEKEIERTRAKIERRASSFRIRKEVEVVEEAEEEEEEEVEVVPAEEDSDGEYDIVDEDGDKVDSPRKKKFTKNLFKWMTMFTYFPSIGISDGSPTPRSPTISAIQSQRRRPSLCLD
eukprot:gene3452-3926_t